MHDILDFHSYFIVKEMKIPTSFDPLGIIIRDLYIKFLCMRHSEIYKLLNPDFLYIMQQNRCCFAGHQDRLT
jgi:hypothetical protein